jgi:alpha-galactosidase
MIRHFKHSILIQLLIVATAFAQNDNFDKNLITLNTKNTSVVYAIHKADSLPHLYYYGTKLNDASDFGKYRGNPIGPMISSYAGQTFREPALLATHANGLLSTELKYISHKTESINDQVQVVTIYLKDKALPFYVTVNFKIYYNEDIIESWCIYKNKEEGEVVLKRFASGAMFVKSEKYFLTKFFGSWFGEMKMEDVELMHGVTSIESKHGIRTSHNFSPSFIISLNKLATETDGELIGGTLAWSGSWKFSFEKDVEENLSIMGGINNFASEYVLKQGEELVTPHLLLTYSNEGKGLLSRNFHTWARKYGMQDGNELRPVVLNSWEGNFFDFDDKKVSAMIKDAAKMGIEMFVLDDGWFGGNKYQRDDDGIALGDWGVNKKRFPKGLTGVIEEAKKQNLKFGIWIEPEMVNEKSEVYEQHPDWVLKEAGRKQHAERNNYVLDLTNPAVKNYVFQSVHKVITQNEYIFYVKWDCNSPVTNPYSPYLAKDEQEFFWVKYIQSFYSICDSLVKVHPNITFQVCASGGGRVDYGSLSYFHEFWSSDNTDAFQRVFIQLEIPRKLTTVFRGKLTTKS